MGADTDRDYLLMTRKKTCWYTCVSPCRIGAIIAGANQRTLNSLRRFGVCMGTAFQIRDDLLDLSGAEDAYGKETAGDIWEGKRTFVLIMLMQRASDRERQRLVRIMGTARQDKRADDVEWVLQMMQRYDCLDDASSGRGGSPCAPTSISPRRWAVCRIRRTGAFSKRLSATSFSARCRSPLPPALAET